MIQSPTPAPESGALTEHSCVRLKRSITLNPAGMLPKGTLGTVISCGPDGEVGVVEFVLDGKSIVVSFTPEQDLLEPAELPAGGLLKRTWLYDTSIDDEEEELEPAEKLHYFAFSFGHLDFVPEQSVQSRLDCVYLGFADKWVSARRISKAKAQSELPSNCVLMSVNYLGHMTKEEFEDE